MEATMLGALLFLVLSSGMPIHDLYVEDPLAVTEEMKSFFEQRVNPHSEPMRRLEGLVYAIFDRDGLNFEYETTTRSAIGTFAHRSGNCLSYTNLLIAIGRHFELDLRFREVEVAPTWSRRGKLVVFNRHVNSIAVVGGQAYLLDLFPRVDRIEIGGRIVDDRRGFAHYFNNLGAEWFEKGSPSVALEFFDRGLELDENASFVWANRAVALSHLGRVEEAEEAYRKAIKIDKNNMVAVANLAELYEKVGRDSDAQKLIKRADDFRRKNPYYHFSLGEQQFENGNFEAAVKHYKDALKRKSKEHHFHHAMAKTLLKLGRTDQAMKHLEKAVKYAPDETGRLRYSQKIDLLAASLNSPE